MTSQQERRLKTQVGTIIATTLFTMPTTAASNLRTLSNQRHLQLHINIEVIINRTMGARERSETLGGTLGQKLSDPGNKRLGDTRRGDRNTK